MIKALALENFWATVFSKAKKQSFVKESHSVKYWLSVGLIAANVILLMSYIYGVNDYTNKGYEIKTLQKKLSALTEDNKKINLKVSQATSMVGIQSDFLNANFVAVGTPKFLSVNNTQFTLK
jgi:hypothetical protein